MTVAGCKAEIYDLVPLLVLLIQLVVFYLFYAIIIVRLGYYLIGG